MTERTGTGEPPWSVSELTRRIEGALTGLGSVRVLGEVSRVVRATSGHVYFDLKDARAKVACLIWRSEVPRVLRTELSEGARIVASGRLGTYAPRGTYSLSVERVEPAGEGELYARYCRLKRQLADKGWFKSHRPLPRTPRRIGVVTSRDGAALRDFLRTRSLRWPGYPVRLAHAKVQGPGAAEEIADAIRRLASSGVDVICLLRGGGSLEDLWAFNEEPVWQAMGAVRGPVYVTGIGHQTDETLADLVADVRAHTPTDAAQTVIPDRAALLAALRRAGNDLLRAGEGLVARRAERLGRAARARVLRDPEWILGDRRRTLEHLGRALVRAPASRLSASRARLRDALRRLQAHSPALALERARGRLGLRRAALARAFERVLARRSEGLGRAAARLDSISPLKVLARGYSVTTRADSQTPLLRAEDVRAGERIATRLAEGILRSRVEDVLLTQESPAARPPPGSLPA